MEIKFSKKPLFFLLLLLSIAPYNNNSFSAATDLSFIKTSCTATTYPKLCFTSLSSHANKIQTDPELLTETAIHVALSSTVTMTSPMLEKLLKGKKLSPREAGAVADCVEEMKDSIDELRRSVEEMKKLRRADLEAAIANIQTWLSAALTDEDTCSEGFAGKSMDGDVKVVVRQQIEKISHLTSNALALVNRFADIH